MITLLGKATSAALIIALALPMKLCGGSSGGNNNNNDTSFPDAGTPPAGESIFAEGCPLPGRAVAREITNPDVRANGPDALGGVGDFLLMNEQAAFIVQGTDFVKTYYHYGGIVIDAVAVDGCSELGRERFDELGLIVGKLDPINFASSTLRMFRGDSVEIINDGTDGGEARIRVHGADDYFWLIEYELLKWAIQAGNPKQRSDPFGVEMAVDYVLMPDSPVLRIEIAITNLTSDIQTVLAGGIVFFGDTSDIARYRPAAMSFGGLSLDFGMPWVVAASREGDGAWAIGIQGGNVANTEISGVNAVIDIDQVFDPLSLGPAGGDNATKSMTMLFSVGGTDLNSAVRHLQPVNPASIPDLPHTLHAFAGRVTDSDTGEGLAGARLEVQLETGTGSWEPLDGFVSDAAGNYGGEIPDFGDPALEYRLVAHLPGRPAPDPVFFTVPATAGLDVTFGGSGTLSHDVQDGTGAAIPAKITIWEGGRLVDRFYALGAPGTREVAPGTYEVSVTRGYEYEPHEEVIVITAGQTTNLAAVLDHVVDTTGFLSYDGHVHAGPSPDSKVLIPDRIVTAAAEGLEVVAGTDHEVIRDWRVGVTEAGMEPWVTAVLGQEVTASLPEHTNMYPVAFDPDQVRGSNVVWWGLDIAEIYAAERARGAGVIQLNHPRDGCNYLCVIGYDRLTGQATWPDPTNLGLPSTATLWSWDFDAVEYHNGHKAIFVDSSQPESTGIFDDWMSFLNHGARITAVAVTDVHGWDAPGLPRTYFAAPTDDPAQFAEDDLVLAVTSGQVVASTGAFARVSLNGSAGLGDTVSDGDGTVDLELQIQAISGIDVTHFKVFVNCDEVLNVATTDPNGVVKYDDVVSVPVTEDSHVVVLGFGRNFQPRGLKQFNPTEVPRFTTNPIYVDFDGSGDFDPPGGKSCSYTLDPP